MTSMILEPGQVIRVRSGQYLVEDVIPSGSPESDTRARLGYLVDDAQDNTLEVIWEREIDDQALEAASWECLDSQGFDNRTSTIFEELEAIRLRQDQLRQQQVELESIANNSTLEAAGKAYYKFPTDLRVRYNEGLTTYNHFRDSRETNLNILKLRELHAQKDRAVLDTYGWIDIAIDCKFLLDYEDRDDEETSKRKKIWRDRWLKKVHDEVLAHRLKFN